MSITHKMDVLHWILSTKVYTFFILISWFSTTAFVRGFPELCDTGIPSDFPSTCTLISTSLVSWSSGRSFCQLYGGDLISVHREEEQNELAQLLQQLNVGSHGVWIGLNDLSNASIFEWADGSPINYTFWNPVMENWNPENDTGSCVYMNPQMHWDIANCSLEGGFVCLANTFSLKNEGCDEGIRFRNSCYWLVLDEIDRKRAENWCNSEYGQLAVIDDELENMFLYNIMMTQKNSYWIGIQPRTEEIQRTTEHSDYSNWVESRDASLGNCPIISRGGKWVMQPCLSVHPAICEKPVILSGNGRKVHRLSKNFAVECPVKWTKYIRRCYLMEKKSLLTWDDALNHCLGLGGQLASFQSKQDEQLVFKQMNGVFDINDIRLYWIGLKCNNISDHAVGITWNDGTPLTYHMLDPNEERNVKMSNPDSSEFCIAHSIESNEWLCLPCDLQVGSTCSRSLPTKDYEQGLEEPTTISAIAVTREPLVCPVGWQMFENNCYIISRSIRTWMAAKDECRKFGDRTDLASIHSALQQEFVIRLMKNGQSQQAWIGLNDYETEGNFEWSDGSAIDFSLLVNKNFHKLTQRWEDCVMLNTKVSQNWIVTGCEPKLPFICKQVLLDETELVAGVTTYPTTSMDSNLNSEDAIHFIEVVTDALKTAVTAATSDLEDDSMFEVYGMTEPLGDLTAVGMSGGTIAGIVLGCLILTALFFIGLIYLYQRGRIIQAVKTKISFENNLYNPYGDQIQLHPTVQEATT